MAHKKKIKAIENINNASAACEAAIQDGQKVAEVLLDAKVKLGEFTKAIKTEQGARTDKEGEPIITKEQMLKKLGIKNHVCQEVETLANYPQYVEMEKNRAKKQGDLPIAKNIVRSTREERKMEAQKSNPNYDPVKEEEREIIGLSNKAYILSEGIKQKKEEVKKVIANKGNPYDKFKACHDTLTEVLE